MTAAGFDSQVGYAAESSFGTFTNPTRAIEHVKSGLKSTRTDSASKGIKAGRRTKVRTLRGREVVAGAIAHELSPAAIGQLLVQGMGAVSTTGAGPYEHVITPGPLVETRGMSVQVGTPSFNGTVNPLNFSGCQIPSGTITVKAGDEPAMIDFDWVGQHMQNTADGDTVAALVSAVYNSAWSPFTGLNAVLTIDGAEYEFDDLTFSFDNGLRTGHYTAKSTHPDRANKSKEQNLRSYGLAVKSDLWDLDEMIREFAGTDIEVSLALTSGTSSLTLDGLAHSPVDTPTVDGMALVKKSLNFEFLSPTADAAAMTWTLVNGDSAP